MTIFAFLNNNQAQAVNSLYFEKKKKKKTNQSMKNRSTPCKIKDQALKFIKIIFFFIPVLLILRFKANHIL